jgi:hypothetical protein
MSLFPHDVNWFGILLGGGILYSGNVSTSDSGRTMILGEDGIQRR